MTKENCTDKEFLLMQELEYYKELNAILMKISKMTDKESYLIEELRKYKKLIEELKTLNLYECDIDYDWDENPIEVYWPADLDEHIEEFLAHYEDEQGKSKPYVKK